MLNWAQLSTSLLFASKSQEDFYYMICNGQLVWWKLLKSVVKDPRGSLEKKRHWKFIIFWFFSFEVRDGAAQKKSCSNKWQFCFACFMFQWMRLILKQWNIQGVEKGNDEHLLWRNHFFLLFLLKASLRYDLNSLSGDDEGPNDTDTQSNILLSNTNE